MCGDILLKLIIGTYYRNTIRKILLENMISKFLSSFMDHTKVDQTMEQTKFVLVRNSAYIHYLQCYIDILNIEYRYKI